MQAPQCFVCGATDWTERRYHLVRFADAPMTVEITGPQGLWLCVEHAQLGFERQHLTTAQATAELLALRTPAPVVAHYIVLDHDVALSKRNYRGWPDIARDWVDFKTSLGPWSEQDLVEYFEEDFGEEDAWPFSRSVIAAFYASDQKTIRSS